MKIFVAGATGILGRRLVPLLVSNASGPCRTAAGSPVGKHQFDWDRSRS
jgi:uncharacterized protein YbjT (DUF2867 family)